MAGLGEFGAELAVVDGDDDGPDTFTFHGHEFTLPEKVSSLPMLRYAYDTQQVVALEERAQGAAARARTEEQRAAAGQQMAEVQLAANAALYAFLRDMLPGQWDRFERVAAQHGVDEQELLDVAAKIMAAVAARPTRRSSGSPAGPSTTGGTSTGDYDSQPASQPAQQPAQGRSVVVVTEQPMATVTPLTPLELARAEILDASRTVDQLARSGT
jgi:hypothetical protein